MKVKKGLSPGKSVDYTIKRDGYDRQVTVTLAPMPADVLARYIGQHMLDHASAGIATGKQLNGRLCGRGRRTVRRPLYIFPRAPPAPRRPGRPSPLSFPPIPPAMPHRPRGPLY
ncbi:MAG TPA: hypothetical protein VFG08_01580, partial [Candidatus Polarisedimenticolia bacterium]|nr:hypothetical protein [Candidatus Polarisedimenticolia bacterium]